LLVRSWVVNSLHKHHSKLATLSSDTGFFLTVGDPSRPPYPYAPSNQLNPYRQHEGAKHRAYEERDCEIKHASFSPLVFSTSGGMGASTTVTYKHLTFLLSLKWKTPYCKVIRWLCCRLGFSLLHSTIMCIRGSCSSSGCPLRGHIPPSVELALEEGQFGAV